MIRFISSNLPEADVQTIQKSSEAFDRLLNDQKIGFLQINKRDHLWSESQLQGSRLRSNYDQMVLVGIGGSSLGPQFLSDVFGASEKFFVLDNPDPIYWNRFTSWVKDWSKLSFVIVSKSGKTLETLSLAEVLLEEFKKRNLAIKDRLVVVTEHQTQPLYSWASQIGCPILEVPLDVGGRFSVLTPVGLLPAAFMGVDLDSLRRGVSEALTQKDLISKLVAQSLISFKNEKWITAFWCYSSVLRFYGLWMQQLWAESLAKALRDDKTPADRASTPLPLVGALDQHSILQQLMEGANDKWTFFMRVKNYESSGPVVPSSAFPEMSWMTGHKLGYILNAEQQASYEALNKSGKWVSQISIDSLDAQGVGNLLMLSQLWVATLGYALQINPFDQPGVELGKRLIREMLSSR